MNNFLDKYKHSSSNIPSNSSGDKSIVKKPEKPKEMVSLFLENFVNNIITPADFKLIKRSGRVCLYKISSNSLVDMYQILVIDKDNYLRIITNITTNFGNKQFIFSKLENALKAFKLNYSPSLDNLLTKLS